LNVSWHLSPQKKEMLELNPNRKVATKGGSVPEFLEISTGCFVPSTDRIRRTE